MGKEQNDMLTIAARPDVHKCLSAALIGFSDMDPVDALQDARLLLACCERRAEAAAAAAIAPPLHTYDVTIRRVERVLRETLVRLPAPDATAAANVAKERMRGSWNDALIVEVDADEPLVVLCSEVR